MYKFIENFKENLKAKKDTRDILGDRSETYRFKFDNGYGGSVIRRYGSYGYDQGLWELAVIKYDEDDNYTLCYDTDITDDVLGYLLEDEVCKYLEQIKTCKKEKNQMREYLIDAIGDDIYSHLYQTTETACTVYNGHHGDTSFHSCCYSFIFENKRVKVYENDDCPYSMAIQLSDGLNIDDKHNLSMDDVIAALRDLIKEEEIRVVTALYSKINE